MSGRALSLAFALAVTLAGFCGPAAAANLLELNFYLSGPRFDGQLPTCDSSAALNRIAARFSEKEGRYWQSDLTIAAFQDVRETAFRSWAPNAIPRRFCSALALVTDGVKRPIHYSIGEDSGMAGQVWGVEWCVEGLDRNWAYNPRCKMARP
jgi:hypothetical protein